ncbi:LEA type 2 family protein [Oceanihabitans sp. IOP_32]|uniref:LEA type 2 family protein n=1 Tax=Oceanihabitans sp. IOP_32 TaxID=2529032 RepID=UPI001D176500|nr:LEA type 2 family protein [Oceanihabitans sp. IOP_32]
MKFKQVKILKYKNNGIKFSIILSTILFVFSSCSVKQKPVFLNVENIKVVESTPKHLTLTANALFLNPNDIGGQLKTEEIKVFVNDNEMGTVSSKSFNVPAKQEFSIPLNIVIPTDSIFSHKNLGGLLGSLFSQQLKVQYKGILKYKVLGFSHRYQIDKTDNIKIKL